MVRNLVIGLVALLPAIGIFVGLTAAATGGGEAADATYVGSKTCKKCHSQQYKSWAKTKMGQALDTLKPNERTEAKTAAKLDPAKDYSTDSTCLKCHTVGYGSPTGYAVPDLEDKKAVRNALKLAHVGCESCHGPGSEYSKLHMDLLMSGRTYTRKEMYAAGMTQIDETTCTACHNQENPQAPEGFEFDFETQKEVGIHEHFPLKQRTDQG